MIPEFLLNMLDKQYGTEIKNDIIKGYSLNRAVTLRVNTLKSTILKIKDELNKNNIDFTDVKWSENALIINNATEKDIESLDIYENGEIYLQSLSSMLPPIFLNPKENTDILDMAAAPGGKTTQIAAITNNKAHITACEMNPIRAERLKYNIDKQGATCIYVMQKDSRNLDNFFSFDQILLDAPCSGSGTIDINNPKLNTYFTEKLIEKSVSLQKSLLQKAINLLKPGSEMIYSTCSILEQENETIVNEIIKRGKVEVVPIILPTEMYLPLLPTKIAGTICIKPTNLYEGFFVAKLRKK